MSRVFLDIVIIASEKQKGSDAAYTYHYDDVAAVDCGSVVFVPLIKQTVIGVVIAVHHVSPAFSTKALISLTPFKLSHVQVELAQWMARHYHTSLADIFGLFVTNAIVPAPTRYWQITETGLLANLIDLPNDERGILYIVREHHIIDERTLISRSQRPKSALAPLRKWLIARGYITTYDHIDLAETALPKIKIIRYVDTKQKLTAKQQAIVEQLIASPTQSLPLAHFGQTPQIKRLVANGTCEIIEQDPQNSPIAGSVRLSTAQQHITNQILAQLQQHTTYILDGVTGSGKTEIYFALIDRCLEQGLQVLVLAPEIALTTQLAARFSNRFPGRVGVVHGQITPKQRRQYWVQSMRGTLPIIIGPRSALYVPQPKLGLIIVDEEHDTSYKSEFAPFVHARDTAIMYAKIAGIPAILGSATPSVEIMHAVTQHKVTHLVLPNRIDVTGEPLSLPPVRIVDMRTESCIDSHALISTTLAAQIHDVLSQHQQVLLLLNRRGNTGARICRNCGVAAKCHRCSTPMATHRVASVVVCICHTCGAQRYPDLHCAECYGVDFIEYGSGTQRVVEIMHEHFPQTTVIQWDRDTADSAYDHRELLNRAQSSPTAIIVGTQMIAKGLDLPNIRLVGVINTDIALHLPDFRAAERTYQLLTQVAGRAGRRQGQARVILQSFQPENYAIQAAARYQSKEFYAQELQYRAQLGYPPFQRLIKLTWQHQQQDRCAQNAQHESSAIQTLLNTHFPTARMIGPTPAFFSRIRGRYRWQLLILTSQTRALLPMLDPIHRAIVDVDPVSLL